jgi:septal ring factor EnvC (AmiA/AmiB activator)
MSVISDRLKKTIQSVFDLPKDNIEKKIDRIVQTTRKGEDEGESIKDVLKQIEDTESKIKQIDDIVKTVSSVIVSLKAAQKVGEATEKAATISSALNPAAAATSVAQKIIVDKVKTEVKESEDALNVTPNLIDNFKKFIEESKAKLKKAQRERKRKKLIKEQRKRKLNS